MERYRPSEAEGLKPNTWYEIDIVDGRVAAITQELVADRAARREMIKNPRALATNGYEQRNVPGPR